MRRPFSKRVKIISALAVLLALGAFAIWLSFPKKLAARLGYPSDARLLIIHADDFGVCHSVNAATIRALETGAVTSASLMVPCPGFEEAAVYCRDNPEADVGLHLTFTNEYEDYHWGPVSSALEVPSLVDKNGHFYLTTEQVWEHGAAEQVEMEMRAQIEKALKAGIRPTHVDSHMGVLFGAKFILVYLRVASEYHLPAMMPRQYISSEQSQGLRSPHELLQRLFSLWLDASGHLMIDRLYIGGLDEIAIPQTEYYPWVIENLGPGVNQVLVHLAFDGGDLRSLGNEARRVEDFRVVTSPKIRELLESKKIVLIGYRPILELGGKR
jgi:predicted glycoside hydrolase/deacetylase ChbG (UPF0249 family)